MQSEKKHNNIILPVVANPVAIFNEISFVESWLSVLIIHAYDVYRIRFIIYNILYCCTYLYDAIKHSPLYFVTFGYLRSAYPHGYGDLL